MRYSDEMMILKVSYVRGRQVLDMSNNITVATALLTNFCWNNWPTQQELARQGQGSGKEDRQGGSPQQST